MLCIGEFIFFSRLRILRVEHIKKYPGASIDTFPRIQLGHQNFIFVTMVIATVKQVSKGHSGVTYTVLKIINYSTIFAAVNI